MRIAFHAPMKPPDDPTPSGDRLMARQLIAALDAGGHEVRIASRLRTRLETPTPVAMDALEAEAGREAQRALAAFRAPSGPWRPDLWLTYHLYYKAPDLVGPAVAQALGLPYVAVEASWSPRRELGDHARWAAHAAAAMRRADLIVSFTERDEAGLKRLSGRAGELARLDPFLADAGPEPARGPRRDPARLVTVAMMRPGRKAQCYLALAGALETLGREGWRLDVVGDGAARPAIEAAFSFARGAVRFRGALDAGGVREALDEADIFVWPGLREPFGMVYLEASARGLPVVALRSGGVEAVVRDGETGLLADEEDAGALADALRRLIDDAALRGRLGAAGRRFVADERGLAAAARRLDLLLRGVAGGEGRAA